MSECDKGSDTSRAGPGRTGAAARPHLLFVGGGHAHIQVFRDFAQDPPDCDLTLLVDNPEAMYSGMVPGFIAGQYERSELTLDLAAWAQRLGARLVLGRATGFDPQRKRVQVADGEAIAYDLCSWNIGSTIHGSEVPGVRQHALCTRPIAGFVDQALARLEAALTRKPGAAAAGAAPVLNIAVVGAGAAGVELALCLQTRALKQGAAAVAVSLFSASATILPGSPASLHRRIERELVRRQVAQHCSRTVIEVQKDAIVLDDGELLPADLVVWVTGAAAHLKPGDGNTPLTPRGWIPVTDTLQHVQHADVFAVGDCAELQAHPETPKAGVYSVREGPVLTHNLRALLSAGTLQNYTPQPDFLALLNLGDGRAAGCRWGRSFSGAWVMALKNRIDRAFVERFA